jgi:rare lipoprotein A
MPTAQTCEACERDSSWGADKAIARPTAVADKPLEFRGVWARARIRAAHNHCESVKIASLGAWRPSQKPNTASRLIRLFAAIALLCCACSAVRWPGAAGLAIGRSQVGIASFYGKRHRGQATASGELYDETLLTAAHPSLPFGSRLEVTNLENSRSVIVRVNDRGPFVANRIIDVSLAAARALGIAEDGTARVRIRRLR